MARRMRVMLVANPFIRALFGIDKRLIRDYLRQEQIAKLHIGCGKHYLRGWLNADLSPASTHALALDAGAPFPFENEVFQYVYSEHMIEHLEYAESLFMLSECFRVLKRGGKIRIATPDLQFLIDLCRSDKSDLQVAYIKWATDEFLAGVSLYEDTLVINNFMRTWGHKLIYDTKLLYNSLTTVGFTGITKCELNESEVTELQGLEHENRLPSGFVKLESMVLEATKSQAGADLNPHRKEFSGEIELR
jgi:predicted SAM-dependent methyltransferase